MLRLEALLNMNDKSFNEDITIINLYLPNSMLSKYIIYKLTDLQWEIVKFIITIGDFNTKLWV